MGRRVLQHQLSFVRNHTLGRVQRVQDGGRWYLVAPVSMIVPDSVLNGSKGSLFYSSQETRRSVRDWDGVPITDNHPYDPVTNDPLSAGDDGVWERQGIGEVRNTVFDSKLRARAWFDEERTRRISPTTYQALTSNRPMEVSTGLYTDNYPAPPGATDKRGRPYDFVAKNYRPDHLAVLPHQTGACSINDGCGLLVNASDMKKNGQLSKAITDAITNLVVTINAERSPVGTNAERHPLTGQYQPGVHTSAKRGGSHTREEWEPAEDEEDEDDSGSELVGKRNEFGDDGRGIASVDREGSEGLSDDQDTTVDESPKPKRQIKGPDDGKRTNNSLLTNAELGVNAEFASDEQREAFFGLLKAGKTGSDKEANEKSATAHKRTELAKKSNLSRRAGEHAKAAAAHREAAEAHENVSDQHRDMANRKGTTEEQVHEHQDMSAKHARIAEGHRQAAEEHETKSKELTKNHDLWVTYNAKWTQGKRDKTDPKDFAGPGQSFPIKDQSDVKDAWDLRGHADDPEAVGQKVKAIAKRKGLKPPAGEPATNWSPTEQQDRLDVMHNAPLPTGSTSMYGPTAHDTTMKAVHASTATEHAPSIAHAHEAMQASSNDNPADAVGFHEKAAKSHDKEAVNCMTRNDLGGAMEHQEAASMHRAAMTHHKSTMTRNSHVTNAWSEEARQAAMEARKASAHAEKASEKHGGWASKQAGDTSGLASQLTDESKVEGGTAREDAGGKQGHVQAAKEHRDIAEDHSSRGEDKAAAAHVKAAAAHDKAAKAYGSTNNRRTSMRPMTRERALNILTRNCECETTKNALVEQDDKSLFKLAFRELANNAKAEGSNADTIGGEGSTQAGGEEDHEEASDADEMEDHGKKTKAKDAMTGNSRLTLDEQQTLNYAKQVLAREKRQLIQPLVRNMQANGLKQDAVRHEFKRLMGMSIPEINSLLAMVPRQVDNSLAVSPIDDGPVFLGANGGDVSFNVGTSTDNDLETLEAPTLNYAELSPSAKKLAAGVA